MKDLSKEGVNVKNSNVLPGVEVEDNTTTKGKASAKFTLVDDATATESIEKIDKNKLFAEIADYLCPVKFDWRKCETLKPLIPLIENKTIAFETIYPSIEAEKKNFLLEHSDEIEAANKLSFAEVIRNIQRKQSLYEKLLSVCSVSEFKESEYIKDGKVLIYRASQCTDKDGNNRYQDATLTKTENGRTFMQPLFVEIREQSTTNILLSIRYYQSKQNATKSLLNKVGDYRRILTNVSEVARKAKENGFSLEQIINEVNKVFA